MHLASKKGPIRRKEFKGVSNLGNQITVRRETPNPAGKVPANSTTFHPEPDETAYNLH